MSKLLAGRYELIDKIGEGGMAVVYRAKDRLLNRHVAIKILRPEYTRDEQFIESFKRESQAAAGLQHPNIVAVYDVGKSGNINYIVMELVDGRPLSELIEEQAPFDFRTTIDITKQMASALSLAHKHQIIHRDVKPHNILVNTDGVAKLTDFGIARAVSNSAAMTDTSKIIGSVHYFSPEQARGSYVDERSDIYSLGIVMYEMLTGRVPFDGENPVEVALKHINEEIIPPSKLVKGIPPNLEKCVMKATDKFQTNRYKSAEEMLEDLSNIEFVYNYTKSGVGIAAAAETLNASGIKNVPVDEDELNDIAQGKITGKREVSDGSGDGGNGKGSKNGKDKRKTILIAGLALAAILLIALLLLWLNGGIGGSDEVKVPDLSNMTYDEAENRLKELGLNIKRGDDISSDDVEEGKVVQQMPISGSNVKPGKTITVRLSSGPGEIEVPDLKGMTFDEAKAAIEELGLKIVKGESAYSDTVEKDHVITQEPQAKSSAKPGETVVVSLSLGKEDTTELVPNLIGNMYTSRTELDSYLSGYGFKLGEVAELESAMEPGTIIDQNPGAGVTAEKNSYINIVIAKAVSKVQVPSLTGMTINEAEFICSDRGLSVVMGDLVEDPTGVGVPGTIIKQSIEQGTQVDPGTTITVYVIKETVQPQPSEPDENSQEDSQNTGETTEDN